MVGKRDEGVGVSYNPLTNPFGQPTEFLGFMASTDFSNDDIAHINQHAEMCTVSYNEIVMDPGSCPGHASAAKSASNLPSVTITAPSGSKVVYRTVEEKRTWGLDALGRAKSCTSYSVKNTSGSMTLGPGDSVTLRPQTASIGSSGGTMYRKRVQLISVTQVDTTKTCPDGSVISSGQQCPSNENGDNGDGGNGGNGGNGNGGGGGGYDNPTGMNMNTLAIIGGVSAVAVIGVVGTVLMLKKK